MIPGASYSHLANCDMVQGSSSQDSYSINDYIKRGQPVNRTREKKKVGGKN